MQEWSRQQQQQQQSQQSGQPQRPAWGSPASSNPGASAGLASLLRAAAPPSPSSPEPPAPSSAPARSPWASPSSSALRRAHEKRLAASAAKSPGIIDELEGQLADLNLDDFLSDINRKNNESIADVKYRLRPSIGRTVHIDKNGTVDLARGLGLLNLRVRVNKVAQDVSRQRFHERPGLKRKRLRRERWRARFKEGFKATCKRVQELARQGW